MKISDIGEFGLIDRIAAMLPASPRDVVVGIGDDVAVLRAGGPELLLATCDAQVEGVHFLRSTITPYQLGRKIIAINASDIAAMGGNPAWALVSMALPPDTEVSFVDELYRGMREELQRAGAAIVGGNLSRTRTQMVIDLSLLGRVHPEHLILRKGARPGDAILVTGWLGDSRAGLEVIGHPGIAIPEDVRHRVMERHLTPVPRVKEGQALGRSGLVHAMADVSDGLVGDIGHICRASRVGAEIDIESLPVSPQCRAVAHATGGSPEQWALSGGEDYELLFTTAPESAAEACGVVEALTGAPCRVVGRIMGEEPLVVIRHRDGRREVLSTEAAGWDHFRGSTGL